MKLKRINIAKNMVPKSVELFTIIDFLPIILPIKKCKHNVWVKAITIDEEQALHNLPARPNWIHL